MEKEKLIKESIERSKRKYQLAKERQEQEKNRKKEFKQKCHEGNKFIEDNKENVVLGEFIESFNGKIFNCCFAIKKTDKTVDDKMIYELAFAIKSPKDKFKRNIGMGIAGHRLKYNSQKNIYVSAPIMNHMNKDYFNVLSRTALTLEMLEFSKKIPERLKREISKVIRKTS